MSAALSLVSVSAPMPVDKLSDTGLADETGELLRQYAVWKPQADRLECLKKEVVRRCESIPAESPAFIDGCQYRVQASCRESKKSLVSLSKIKKALGIKAFMAAVSITLGALEEALKLLGKGEQFSKFYTEARTGPRTVTAVAKSAPAA